MNKKLFPSLIFGASLLGCLLAFALSEASARWNPNSPIQIKCDKHRTPKKCNKDKECFWSPVQPQCQGNVECARKYFTDEKACKEAKKEGCYWFVPTAEELSWMGYCYEKGSFPETEKPKP